MVAQNTPPKKLTSPHTKKDYKLLLILAPFVIFTFFFAYVPLFGWSFSFFDYKPAISLFKNKFVGFANFTYMLKDYKEIMRVMKNTVTFAALGYLVSPLPIVLALLLNEVRSAPYKRIVQTVTTFPNFISWVIVYSLAFQMFSYEGLVSSLMQKWGLSDMPVSPIASKDSVYLFQTLISLWKGLGWNTIIYMSAIAGVEQELYEAAAVDGAGRFRAILHITLPSLLPTYIVLQLLAVSSFVGVGFDQYYVFRNSITSANIDVIDVYTYNIGIGNSDFSYATAIGVLKSLISITLLFCTNQLAKKIRGNSIV